MATDAEDCCVCLEPLNDPLAFGCGHTVCGACFPKLDGGCPLCRHGKPPIDHSSCAVSYPCYICHTPLDPASLLVNVILGSSGTTPNNGSILQCGHAYCKNHLPPMSDINFLPCRCPFIDATCENPRPTAMLFSNIFSSEHDVCNDELEDTDKTCPHCFRHGCAFCTKWKDFSVVTKPASSSFHFPIRFMRFMRFMRGERKSRSVALTARLVSIGSYSGDPAHTTAFFHVDSCDTRLIKAIQNNLEELCLKVGNFLSARHRSAHHDPPSFYPFFRKVLRHPRVSSIQWDSDDEDNQVLGFSLCLRNLHPAFCAALTSAPTMANSQQESTIHPLHEMGDLPKFHMRLVFTHAFVSLRSPFDSCTGVLPGLYYLTHVPEPVVDSLDSDSE